MVVDVIVAGKKHLSEKRHFECTKCMAMTVHVQLDDARLGWECMACGKTQCR